MVSPQNGAQTPWRRIVSLSSALSCCFGAGTAAHMRLAKAWFRRVASVVHIPMARRPFAFAALYLTARVVSSSYQTWCSPPLLLRQAKYLVSVVGSSFGDDVALPHPYGFTSQFWRRSLNTDHLCNLS